MFGPFTGWDRREVTAVDGRAVHAVEHGPASAPVVVGVHGLGCSSRYFWPLARALAPQVRLAALDLPGFGRSRGGPVLDVRGQSTVLAAWLRATGRSGSVLVANSTGCQVAVDLAVAFPDVAGPLVLNAPTVDRHARRLRTQAGRLVLDAPRERPSLLAVLAVDYLQCGIRRAYRTFRHHLGDRVEDKAPLVTVPVVVVWGSADPVISRRWALELTAAFPSGRFVELPARPHALNYSAPRDLAGVVFDVMGRRCAR